LKDALHIDTAQVKIEGMGEKVLITGGLGFIGLALARTLVRRGLTVRLLDNLSPQIHGVVPRPELGTLLADHSVEVLHGDVCQRTDWALALSDVTSVVHLAAETGTGQSMYRIGDYTSTNVLGTALLLDALANSSHKVKKLVLASSRAVYGEGAYQCAGCGSVYPPMRSSDALAAGQWEPRCPFCCGPIYPVATPETARTSPASIYAATKLAQEDLVRIAASALGIPHIIFRFQNVYGEGQSLNNPYTGILSIFSNRIRQGKDIGLFEDGQESRDFVHVSDVTEAVALGLTGNGGDGLTMNVGSGVPVSVETIARSLKRQFPGSASAVVVSGQYRLGDIRHNHADISTIRQALRFTPNMNLEDGLSHFASWVKTQPLSEDKLDSANRELIERGLMKA
jgi:dTDP-L-rhamnose 4-epimerase